MKTLISAKRVKALGLLREELAIEDFVSKMWGAAVALKFAKHFLGGLLKLGYVEKKDGKGTEFYKVTEAGIGEFEKTRCGYCGVSRWKLKVAPVDCRICGKDHWTCQKCSKANVVVVGEFPKYRPALRACPKEKT